MRVKFINCETADMLAIATLKATKEPQLFKYPTRGGAILYCESEIAGEPFDMATSMEDAVKVEAEYKILYQIWKENR